MRFLSFKKDNNITLGALAADQETVVDLTAMGLPADLTLLIEMGDEGLIKAETAIQEGAKIPIKEIEIVAPFSCPKRNVMCVGMNYLDHSKEFEKSQFNSTLGGQIVPDAPIIFTKATTSITGPGSPIPASSDSSGSTDYEGELGVVIGQRGKSISKADAFNYIYAYTVINDVTARNTQQLHKQWFLGKSLDGFCPMGPFVVTADEIDDVTKLNLRTFVNKELRQNANVKDLIFDIPTIIATISSYFTIVPGDIIATGTPAGVGIGFKPPKFLKPGDLVTIEIDQLGVLENPVI